MRGHRDPTRKKHVNTLYCQGSRLYRNRLVLFLAVCGVLSLLVMPASSGDVASVVIRANPDLLIGEITVEQITTTGAQIWWTTNDPTDSWIFYDVVSHSLVEEYAFSSGNADLAMRHHIGLSSLTPGTVYHYRIRSTGIDGASALTQDRVFKTLALPPTGGGGGGGGGGGWFYFPIFTSPSPTPTLQPSATPTSRPTLPGGYGTPEVIHGGEASLYINPGTGEMLQSIILLSPNMHAQLFVAQGTVVRVYGSPAAQIWIRELTEGEREEVYMSTPPGVFIVFSGTGVACGPEHTTFSPPIRLTFGPIPEREWAELVKMSQSLREAQGKVVSRGDLSDLFVMAGHFNQEAQSIEWYRVYAEVCPDTRTITATIDHFGPRCMIALFVTPGANTPILCEPAIPLYLEGIIITPAATPVQQADYSHVYPILCVLVGLVLIALVAFGVYYYLRNDRKP